MSGHATTSGTAGGPWLTAVEAADYLRLRSADGSLHAFYLAYERLGIPAYRFRGGRNLRFRQADLDGALERARVEPEPGVEPKLTLPTNASRDAAIDRWHRNNGRARPATALAAVGR